MNELNGIKLLYLQKKIDMCDALQNIDWHLYYAVYDDLQNWMEGVRTKENAYQHFINYGCKEDRIINLNTFYVRYPDFDWKYYVSVNGLTSIVTEFMAVVSFLRTIPTNPSVKYFSKPVDRSLIISNGHIKTLTTEVVETPLIKTNCTVTTNLLVSGNIIGNLHLREDNILIVDHYEGRNAKINNCSIESGFLKNAEINLSNINQSQIKQLDCKNIDTLNINTNILNGNTSLIKNIFCSGVTNLKSALIKGNIDCLSNINSICLVSDKIISNNTSIISLSAENLIVSGNMSAKNIKYSGVSHFSGRNRFYGATEFGDTKFVGITQFNGLSNFNGNMIVNQDLLVNGNLHILNRTVRVNSETLLNTDPILILNANLNNHSDIGIIGFRENNSNISILWKEELQAFKFDGNIIVDNISDVITILPSNKVGKIGINTTSPDTSLHVKGNLTIEVNKNNETSNKWTFSNYDNNYLGLYRSSKTEFSELVGYFDHSAGCNKYGIFDFTGQHRSFCSSFDNLKSMTGYIVCSEGKYINLDGSIKPTIDDSLPIVRISSRENEKTVFGVISSYEDENNLYREYTMGFVSSVLKKEDKVNRLIINSVGEGAIWITNINGNLENGDYITTSSIPGLGMKQNDDLLHNYTVAKITCDCDFILNSETYDCVTFIWNNIEYKKAFVGCTYHCG